MRWGFEESWRREWLDEEIDRWIGMGLGDVYFRSYIQKWKKCSAISTSLFSGLKGCWIGIS
jgi:hypothetical protein